MPERKKDGESMQTPVRYYITCDDDRPVVRTIPVAVRTDQHQQVIEQPVAAPEPTVARDGRKPRVSKRALATARRLRGGDRS